LIPEDFKPENLSKIAPALGDIRKFKKRQQKELLKNRETQENFQRGLNMLRELQLQNQQLNS
jgi:chromosome segregation ATPase